MKRSSCRGCGGDDGGPMILALDDLQIHYSTKDGAVRAVDGASFVVPEGRIVGLVGESGCGKTTAVRAIMGVLPENGRPPTRPIPVKLPPPHTTPPPHPLLPHHPHLPQTPTP